MKKVLLAIFIASTMTASVVGPTASAEQLPPTTLQQGGSVKGTFVLIFRQGNRRLSHEEQKSRTQEVRAWALQHVKEHNLDPRILADESHRLGDDIGSANGAGSVIALNFLEAEDFAHAVQLAMTHPGLRYGVSIEVRSWMDPRAQAVTK